MCHNRGSYVSHFKRMEFERAIFRVYEKCLETVQDDVDEGGNISSKSCKVVGLLSLFSGVFLLSTLAFLHGNYVGNPGCLPYLLAQNDSINYNSSVLLKGDQILRIKIDPRFVTDRNTNVKGLTDDYDDERTTSAVMIASNLLNYIFVPKRNNVISNLGSQQNYTISSKNTEHFADADYLFAFELGVLLTPNYIRNKHNYEYINVSLSGNECFGPNAAQNLISLGGIDPVILNNVMYTFKKRGYLQNYNGQYYHWSDEDVHIYGERYEFWFTKKVNFLINSLISFFLVSTITALLVRILISSGVVLLFPIFWVLQLFGMNAINLRIISLSYPWIGIPMEIIRARNQSIIPFIIAHISKVFLYYILYQATQVICSMWLYNENLPGSQEIWLFATMMLWEYFSMIYIRADKSIRFFPRASLALYLIYHFYLYSYPSGFHLLALMTMVCFLISCMMWCITEYEVKAFHQGLINVDQPRMLYNSTPWPSWQVDLAQEYTLFMPLNARSSSVYQTNIPTRPGDIPPSDNNNNNNATNNNNNNQPSGSSNVGGSSGNDSENDIESGLELNTYQSGGVTVNNNNLNNNNSEHGNNVPITNRERRAAAFFNALSRRTNNNNNSSSTGQYDALSTSENPILDNINNSNNHNTGSNNSGGRNSNRNIGTTLSGRILSSMNTNSNNISVVSPNGSSNNNNNAKNVEYMMLDMSNDDDDDEIGNENNSSKSNNKVNSKTNNSNNSKNDDIQWGIYENNNNNNSGSNNSSDI